MAYVLSDRLKAKLEEDAKKHQTSIGNAATPTESMLKHSSTKNAGKSGGFQNIAAKQSKGYQMSPQIAQRLQQDAPRYQQRYGKSTASKTPDMLAPYKTYVQPPSKSEEGGGVQMTKAYSKKRMDDTATNLLLEYGDKSYSEIMAAVSANDTEDPFMKQYENEVLNYIGSGKRTRADIENEIAQTDAELEMVYAEADENRGDSWAMTDIKNRASALEDKKQRLEGELWAWDQNEIYSVVPSYSDFEKNSGAQDGVRDATYMFINDVDGYRNKAAARGMISGGYGDLEPYTYMTDEEIATYNYLYNVSGKKAANQYLDYLSFGLSEKSQKAAFDTMNLYAQEGGWNAVGASTASVITNLGSGLGYLDVYGQNVVRNVTGSTKPINYNRRAQTAYNLTQGARQGTLSTIDSNFGKTVYNIGMSMADSAVIALLSAGALGVAGGAAASKGVQNAISTAGTSILGGAAATSTMHEVIANGGTDDQALAMGVIAGAAEMVMEKIPIDNLLNFGKIADKGGFIRGIIKQSFSEAGEETLTTIANTVADVIVMGDKNELQRMYNDYIAQGYSADEASKLAGADWLNGLLQDAASGFVSGLGFGAGGSVVGAVQFRNSNAADVYGDAIPDIINEAKEADIDSSYIYRVQGKLDNGKTVKVKEVNRLINKTNKVFTSSDIAKIQEASEARLKELGETGDTGLIASALAKQVAGKRLTSAEREARDSSKFAQRVVNELSVDNILSGEYSTEWSESIGTKRINALAYNLRADNRSDIEKASDKYGVQAKAMAATYDGKQEVEEYDKAYQVAFDVGKENGNIDALKKLDSVQTLSEQQVELAYEAGQAAAKTVELSNVDRIESIKGGKMTIRLSNGNVINSSEAIYASSGIAGIYSTVGSLGVTAPVANNIIGTLTEDTNADVFAKGVAEAFKYGKTGMSMTDLMNNSENAKKLSAEQRNTAYNAGKKVAGEAVARAQAKAEAKKGTRVGKVHYDGNVDSLQGVRRAGYQAAEMAAKMLGTDIYFFESYAKNGGRYYIDANGNEVKSPNGWYDPRDKSIHLDINAGNSGEGIVLFTLAHELTHYIKDGSPRHFKILANTLFNHLGETESVEALIAKKMEAQNLSHDKAYEEVVADAMETVLNSGNVLNAIADIKQQDTGLWNKIKQFFKDFVARLKNIVSTYADARPDSDEGNLVADAEGLIAKLEPIFTEGLAAASENMGGVVEFDSTSESVAPMRSMRTWTESEYVQMRDKAAHDIARQTGVTIDTAYKYIDSINSVAALIADDKVRLDYEPNMDEHATVLKPNSEYKYTVDMSTLCAKRLLFTGTFDAIQKALPNKVFDSEDIVGLREMMMQRGYEVACGICYVESTRREIGRITQDFIDSYREAQKTGKPITRTNSEGKRVDLKKTKDQMTTTVDKSTDKFFAEDGYTPTLADLNTTDIDIVKRDHPLVYEAYLNFMNARGQAKPKLLETRAKYKGEILKHFKAKTAVNARNAAGGLRLQSFSDLEVPHLIDMMQVVMDMSRVGLKSQAYTKVPTFAEAFGNTGVKINLSLIAKGTGLDANGNLIFDDVEGINHKEAFRLREKFSENVGTILVGKSEAHIIAAMADPRIDFIIPFHKSSWKESLYDSLGLTGYDDFTETQNEKPIDKSRKITNFAPSEYWDYSKSGDENAQIYLEKCGADGRIPKFPQFQGYPGYWKLLIDFKMYNNDGVGAPQQVVQPIFDDSATAKILNEYKGGHRNLPVARDVVDDFVKQHEDGEVSYSVRYDYSNDFAQQIDDYKHKAIPVNDTLVVGATPKVFLDIGLNRLPMTYAKGHLKEVLKGTSQDHDFGEALLKQLPSAMKKPLAIIASRTQRTTSLVALLNLKHKGKSIIAAVYIDGTGTVNGVRIDSNAIATVHKRGNALSLLEDAANDEISGSVGVYYLNKKETAKASQQQGLQLPKVLSLPDGYIHKITDAGSPVKRKLNSELESKQFLRWFGNWGSQKGDISKVVNTDGTPRVVYHGTDAKFSEFKLGDVGYHFGTIQQAKNRTRGVENAKIMPVYLSLKNPLVVDYDFGDWHGNNVAEMLIEYDVFEGHANEKEILTRLKNIAGIEDQKTSDVELREYLKELGYDGIQYENHFETDNPYGGDFEYSYIVFESSQVKSVYNVGTYDRENPNIYFQQRSTDGLSNRAILANVLSEVAQDDKEASMLKLYTDNVQRLDEQIVRLAVINAEIKQKSFGKGKRDTARLAELKAEQGAIQKEVVKYDKMLLDLEATAPLKRVLERERKKAYDKARAKGEEALAAQRKKADEKLEATKKQYQESRKKNVEQRKSTVMRNKIKDVVGELNRYLLHGTKDKHIPIGLQKPVAEALDAINMDTVSAEKRIDELVKQIAATKNPKKVRELAERISKIEQADDKMKSKLDSLATAYEEIKKSDDPLIANAYDDVIASTIKYVVAEVGDTPLRDMTYAQLSDVYDMYKMILTKVRDANKAFAKNKKIGITEMSEVVISELKKYARESDKSTVVQEFFRTQDWNNLKPIYAFERMGSDMLTGLYEDLRMGEDTWIKDAEHAKKFFNDTALKYQYHTWDMDKRYEFTSRTGVKFSVSLQQILSLYAYSKREQADAHLEKGGFVFDDSIKVTEKKHGIPVKYTVTTSKAHNLSREILGEILAVLTPEQRAFADEMQTYLSETMGEKGNEVTLQMYGVKLFKEKNYFPLKSASQFLFQQNETAGEVKVKNSGFTKDVTPKASNPIILSDFIDVWTKHVNDMAMYHSFVLPLEDFTRVFNFKTPASEDAQSESVRSTLENAFGKQATGYINQLLTDINGGVVTDSRENLAKKLTSSFKKASVLASLSVVAQQPSAIGRAFAVIDLKYFVGDKIGAKRHKYLWAELKKYAPVAAIKEMGYFDTNMGKSAADFITSRNYIGFKEKAKAVFTDRNYRDELLTKLPALADELTWCAIWDAVKRETRAKNPSLKVSSEEFLTLAGQRFTEVIEKTQVYDSVFARSANMRSKTAAMTMATSFLAEPTTTANMVIDSITKFARGDKKQLPKVLGAVLTSIVLNSALSSFVYGMRDDDEDETYLEKWISSFVTELIDGINPLTYLPYVKDVWSLLQGYDVERADMTLISKLVNSSRKISNVLGKDTSDMDEEELLEHRKNIANAFLDFSGDVLNIFGIPMKNVVREFKAFGNLGDMTPIKNTTWMSLADNVADSLERTLPILSLLPNKSKQDKLYEAITSGDEDYAERIMGTYETESALNTAIRKALRNNDDRIKAAAEAKMSGDADEYLRIVNEIVAEGFFSQDNVIAAIKSEVNAMTEDKTSGASSAQALFNADDYFNAVVYGDAADAEVVKNELIEASVAKGDTRAQAESSVASGFVTNVKNAYEEGSLDKSSAIEYITQFGGKSRDEAETEIKEVDFERKYGYSWSQKDNAFRLGAISEAELVLEYMDIEDMERETAQNEVEKLKFTNEYGFDYSERKNAYLDGKISRDDMFDVLTTTGGKTEREANETLDEWTFEKENGFAWSDRFTAYSEGVVNEREIRTMLAEHGYTSAEIDNEIAAYEWKIRNPSADMDMGEIRSYVKPIEGTGTSIAQSGIKPEVYIEYKTLMSECTGVDRNGDGKADSGTKKAEMLEAIDSLPISDAQKDVLYFANGWAASKLWQAPWH